MKKLLIVINSDNNGKVELESGTEEIYLLDQPITTTTTTIPQEPLLAYLLYWAKMDDNDVGIIPAEVGGDATIYGTITKQSTAPPNGTASYHFGGSGYAHFLNPLYGLPSTQWAVCSFWVRLTTLGSVQTVLTRHYLPQATGSLDAGITSGNNPQGGIWQGAGGRTVTSTHTMVINTWTHVYFQGNPVTGESDISINNGTFSNNSQVSVTPIWDSVAVIGCSYVSSSSKRNYLKGNLAHVKYWSKDLSVSERTLEYNNGNVW